MSLSALMRVGLVEAAFSRIRGRKVFFSCRRSSGGAHFITMGQAEFADRYTP